HEQKEDQDYVGDGRVEVARYFARKKRVEFTHWSSLPGSARVPPAGDDLPPSRTFPVVENSSEVRFGETPKVRAGLALARETPALPRMIRTTLYFSFTSRPNG